MIILQKKNNKKTALQENLLGVDGSKDILLSIFYNSASIGSTTSNPK